jgi:hypothetical protein
MLKASQTNRANGLSRIRNKFLAATASLGWESKKSDSRLLGLPPDRRQCLPEVDRSATAKEVIAGFSWDFQPPGRLPPAISGEESRWVLRHRGMRGPLQIRGVTGGGEGVVSVVTLFSAGRQRVTSWRSQDPADFCRQPRAVCGAEVYRNSTDDSGLGKSAGKDIAMFLTVEILRAWCRLSSNCPNCSWLGGERGE